MFLRWLPIWLTACTVPAGDTASVRGVVRESGGSSITIEHPPPHSPAAATPVRYQIDPNLSRKVAVGDRVEAIVLRPKDGSEPRVIGLEPAAID